MDTLDFIVDVTASPEEVWRALHDDDLFRTRAATFCEGSYREGDWNVGGIVRFLTPDGMGITSLVEESRPGANSRRSRTQSSSATAWTIPRAPRPGSGPSADETCRPAMIEGGIQLRVTVEIPADRREFLEDTWPKSRAFIKGLAESANN